MTGRPIDVNMTSIFWLIGLTFSNPEEIIISTIGGLEKISHDCSYNLIFHMSSEKKSTKQIHWHIEVYPRMQHEDVLGSRTDIYVNNTLPEEAAQVLSKNSTDVLAKLVGIDI